MLRQWKSFVAGAIVSAILTFGVVAFGESITKSISVMYDNIKILIDGVEYTAKDANGNVIEPFIFNGTTYLPVRGIANAFGKEVSWEPQTSTVKLGSVNYDWLDQIGYANYETSGNNNKIGALEKDTQVDGIKYDRGLSLFLGYREDSGAKRLNDDNLESYQNIEYLLNGNYKSFNGKLNCLNDSNNDQNAIIKIYGDGNLIYTSPPLTRGRKTVDFNIDVSNYKVLKINASIPNLSYAYSSSSIGIIEARLAKK
jgi:hypothetical protein